MEIAHGRKMLGEMALHLSKPCLPGQAEAYVGRAAELADKLAEFAHTKTFADAPEAERTILKDLRHDAANMAMPAYAVCEDLRRTAEERAERLTCSQVRAKVEKSAALALLPETVEEMGVDDAAYMAAAVFRTVMGRSPLVARGPTNPGYVRLSAHCLGAIAKELVRNGEKYGTHGTEILEIYEESGALVVSYSNVIDENADRSNSRGDGTGLIADFARIMGADFSSGRDFMRWVSEVRLPVMRTRRDGA